MKQFLTFEQKKKIVDEAYGREKNISATARAYNISPAQIRRWKSTLNQIFSKTCISASRRNHLMGLKILNVSKPRKNAYIYKDLKLFYDKMRSMGHVITIKKLCAELKRLHPTTIVDSALYKRVDRWIRSEEIFDIEMQNEEREDSQSGVQNEENEMKPNTELNQNGMQNEENETKPSTARKDHSQRGIQNEENEMKPNTELNQNGMQNEKNETNPSTANVQSGMQNEESETKPSTAQSKKVCKKVPRILGNTATTANLAEHMKEKILLRNISVDHTVSVDELLIEFDIRGCAYVANLKSQVSDAATPQSSASCVRCSVILAVTLSGDKLPPFIVFKGTPNGQINREVCGKMFSSHICSVHEKAMIDERVFLVWIKKVWGQLCWEGTLRYLLVDDSSVHRMPSCLDAMRQHNTEMDFLLEGCKNIFHILPLGIHHTFMEDVKQSYEQYYKVELKKPTRLDIAKWISCSWCKVPRELIHSSWTTVGFTDDMI